MRASDARFKTAVTALVSHASTLSMLESWVRSARTQLKAAGLQCAEVVVSPSGISLPEAVFGKASMRLVDPATERVYQLQALLLVHAGAGLFGRLAAALEVSYRRAATVDAPAVNVLVVSHPMLEAPALDPEVVAQTEAHALVERLLEHVRTSAAQTFSNGTEASMAQLCTRLDAILTP